MYNLRVKTLWGGGGHRRVATIGRWFRLSVYANCLPGIQRSFSAWQDLQCACWSDPSVLKVKCADSTRTCIIWAWWSRTRWRSRAGAPIWAGCSETHWAGSTAPPPADNKHTPAFTKTRISIITETREKEAALSSHLLFHLRSAGKQANPNIYSVSNCYRCVSVNLLVSESWCWLSLWT